MKRFLIGMSVFSVVAMAAPASRYEELTVKKIEQVVNLMPPIPPGGVTPRTTLTVDVISSGCTNASDFQVYVNVTKSEQQVQVIRLRPDLCEVVPHVEEIEIRTNALKSAKEYRVKMVNPLLAEVSEIH